MLEKQVDRPRRWRGPGPASVAVMCSAGVFAAGMWLAPVRTPLVVVTPTVVPPAQVLVEVPEPGVSSAEPPEAPVAAPPQAPAESPPVGTTCVVDTSTVGMPLGDPGSSRSEILDVRASRGGCTIAALTPEALFVSWDGGQTFAHFAMTGAYTAAVSSGRVAVVRERSELGVVRAGDPDITWRTIAGLAERDGDHTTPITIAADGAWSVVAAAHLMFATDDDGRTWRYLTSPVEAAQLETVEADGHLIASAVVELPQPEGDAAMGAPIEHQTRRFETRIVGGRWRGLPALQGQLAGSTGSWVYLYDLDEFWGCGSSSQLIAARGGRRVPVATGIRYEAYHVSFAAGAGVAFAGHGGRLHRMVGVRSQDVAEMPDSDPRVVAVDGGGAPLATAGPMLMRWTQRGGWRQLLVVP